MSRVWMAVLNHLTLLVAFHYVYCFFGGISWKKRRRRKWTVYKMFMSEPVIRKYQLSLWSLKKVMLELYVQVNTQFLLRATKLLWRCMLCSFQLLLYLEYKRRYTFHNKFIPWICDNVRSVCFPYLSIIGMHATTYGQVISMRG